MDPRLLLFLVLVAASGCIAATVTGASTEPRQAWPVAFFAFVFWSIVSLAVFLPHRRAPV